jgi:hypothetical protein
MSSQEWGQCVRIIRRIQADSASSAASEKRRRSQGRDASVDIDRFRVLLHSPTSGDAYYQPLTAFLTQALGNTAGEATAWSPLLWNPFYFWAAIAAPIDMTEKLAEDIVGHCNEEDIAKLRGICQPWIEHNSHPFLLNELRKVADRGSANARNALMSSLQCALEIDGSAKFDDYEAKLRELLGRRCDGEMKEQLERVYYAYDGSDEFDGFS